MPFFYLVSLLKLDEIYVHSLTVRQAQSFNYKPNNKNHKKKLKLKFTEISKV